MRRTRRAFRSRRSAAEEEEEGGVAAMTGVCLTSTADDRPETEAASGRRSSTSGQLYHAFVHRSLLTSVGCPSSSKQRPSAACRRCGVCSSCAGRLCSRQVEQLIFIPKEDSDDCAIKTNETAKSLLLATVSQSRDDSYC